MRKNAEYTIVDNTKVCFLLLFEIYYIQHYMMIIDFQIYLGSDLTMELNRWTLLVTEEDCSKFCKLLALIIWKPYDLCNRAVDIRKIPNRNRIPGRSPVKELEEEKLRLLISEKLLLQLLYKKKH